MNANRNRFAALPLLVGVLLPIVAAAQDRDQLPEYIPVLPAVKAKALAIDATKAYPVKQVKPDVFVVTDGTYQSAFVTTGPGSLS